MLISNHTGERDTTKLTPLENAVSVMKSSFDNAMAGIVIVDASNGYVKYYNPACLSILGIEDCYQDYLGKPVSEFNPVWIKEDEDGDLILPKDYLMLEALQGVGAVNKFHKVTTPQGIEKWVLVSSYPLYDQQSNIIGSMVIFPDYTYHKESENKLKTYSNIVNNMLLETYLFSKKSNDTGMVLKLVYANEVALKSLHKTTSEIAGHSMQETFSAYFSEAFLGEMLKKVKKDEKIDIDDHLCLNGEYKSCKGFSLGGEFYCVLLDDVTEKNKAKKAFSESEIKYKEVLDLLPIGIYEFDLSGKLTYANKYCKTLFLANENVDERAHNVFEFVASESLEKARNNIMMVVKGMIVFDNEYVGVRYDGSYFPLEIHSTLIIGSEGKPVGVRGVLFDITFKKKMENNIELASRLESLSMLAGGIAHDFNNILTALLGNITLLKTNVKDEGQNSDFLEDMEKASQRAKKLTQQLLLFSKGGNPVKENAVINELIKESAEFVLRGSTSICEFAFAPDLFHVEIDKGQISQVIQNIVINAEQSMPGGGIIHVSVGNITLSSNLLGLNAGDYLKISISDNGTGIPRENLKRIFDPYFTTKSTGSGLGLSICYSIIKKHGGVIEVNSESFKGTVFNIYLPASDEIIPELDTSSEIEKRRSNQFSHILIMDDDKMVCDVTSMMLKSAGYQTVCTLEGKQALERFRRAETENNPFDLVLLDMTIPAGLGGKETIGPLKKIKPNLKSILMSGYFNDSIMHEFNTFGFDAILPKPFSMAELMEIIRKLEG